jgi:uncharacterized protein (DUF2267 family)
MLSNFEKYAEEGNWFINKVAREIGHPGDPALAFRITRAVLRALRDRITIEESMHLISEMPMILKAVYVDGWNIAKERENYDTKDSLLREIAG